MHRNLFSVCLREGESVQQHVKAMTEVIETLLVIGDPTTDEDLVVRLLASLPESYEMIVMALSKFKCACLEMVIERLLQRNEK